MDGSNGWDFSSSEGPVAPKLTVDYITTSTAGLLVTETGGSTTVTEGGQGDSFFVALKSAPTANVTITIAGNPDVDAGPTTLTFTPGNWQTAQTVTLTALDDAVVEGTEVKNVGLSSASADASYDGLSASVSTTILDNDTPPPPAGLVVTETGGSTTVAEGGQGDSILVALKSAPAADVTITIAGNPDVDRDPAILTFTAANWQTAQSVALTAVDDTLVEGTEVKTVGLSSASADPSYDGLSTSISTTILDNDTQGELTVASVTFQQGVDGYNSTYDTMLRESKPTSSYKSAANVNVDGVDSAGKHNQGLLEFGNLFGNGPGQIPLGATITSATLTLNVSDATPQSFTLNRMLIDWSANSAWTWNSFGNGIQADGTEARSTADGTFASIGTGNQGLDVNSEPAGLVLRCRELWLGDPDGWIERLGLQFFRRTGGPQAHGGLYHHVHRRVVGDGDRRFDDGHRRRAGRQFFRCAQIRSHGERDDHDRRKSRRRCRSDDPDVHARKLADGPDRDADGVGRCGRGGNGGQERRPIERERRREL